MLDVAAAPANRRVDPALARSPILHGLPPDDMSALASRFQTMSVRAGSRIYREGEHASQLYVILTGKVKLHWCAPQTCEKLLGILGPTDIFGAESIFDPGPRAGSATALTDVTLAGIDHAALCGCVAGRPHVAVQLMRVLARRLQRTEDLIADLNSTDVPGRVAKQLLRLARRFGVRTGHELHLDHDLTQAEIAQLVGASRESVNKAMSEFAQRRWITVRGRSLMIHRADLLVKRAR